MASRSPSVSPKQLRVRKRATTRAILGNDYEEVITQTPERPMPLPSVEGYDEKRLKESIKFADCALRNTKRKLSPLGNMGYVRYKDACIRLLELERGDVPTENNEELEECKIVWATTIRQFEEALQFQACLHITRTESAQELQDALLDLQRTTFFARYGDYFADACRMLKSAANHFNTLGNSTFNGQYWTQISERLKDEEQLSMAYMKESNSSSMSPDIPTTIAVTEACQHIGFAKSDMIQIIHLYSARNELLHANLPTLIQQGKIATVAKTLWADFCELDKVLPADMTTDYSVMETLLKTLIDIWFTRKEPFMEEPENWKATGELDKFQEELLKKGSNTAEVVKNVSKAITKQMALNLRDQEKEKNLIETLNATTFSEVPSKKRVASSQLEKEKELAKKMKSDWEAISNQAANVKKKAQKYQLQYGRLGYQEVVVDPLMDDVEDSDEGKTIENPEQDILDTGL